MRTPQRLFGCVGGQGPEEQSEVVGGDVVGGGGRSVGRLSLGIVGVCADTGGTNVMKEAARRKPKTALRMIIMGRLIRNNDRKKIDWSAAESTNTQFHLIRSEQTVAPLRYTLPS